MKAGSTFAMFSLVNATDVQTYFIPVPGAASVSNTSPPPLHCFLSSVPPPIFLSVRMSAAAHRLYKQRSRARGHGKEERKRAESRAEVAVIVGRGRQDEEDAKTEACVAVACSSFSGAAQGWPLQMEGGPLQGSTRGL